MSTLTYEIAKLLAARQNRPLHAVLCDLMNGRITVPAELRWLAWAIEGRRQLER